MQSWPTTSMLVAVYKNEPPGAQEKTQKERTAQANKSPKVSQSLQT